MNILASESEDKFHASFEAGNFYHLFNRGNNGENIFYTSANYSYFLPQFGKYMLNYLEVYSYCLMPNHFHFFVRINKLQDHKSQSTLSEQLRRFFIGYSQAINKQEKRTGSLFQKRMKRILVKDDDYFTQIILYIHHNPIHHKFVQEYADWEFSSYGILRGDSDTFVRRKQVLDWFGGKDEFIEFHRLNKKLALKPEQIY